MTKHCDGVNFHGGLDAHWRHHSDVSMHADPDAQCELTTDWLCPQLYHFLHYSWSRQHWQKPLCNQLKKTIKHLDLHNWKEWSFISFTAQILSFIANLCHSNKCLLQLNRSTMASIWPQNTVGWAICLQWQVPLCTIMNSWFIWDKREAKHDHSSQTCQENYVSMFCY